MRWFTQLADCGLPHGSHLDRFLINNQIYSARLGGIHFIALMPGLGKEIQAKRNFAPQPDICLRALPGPSSPVFVPRPPSPISGLGFTSRSALIA